MITFAIGTSLFTLVACNENTPTSNIPEEEQGDGGSYQVTFTPVNSQLGGNTNALGLITLDGDDFSANIAGNNFKQKESGNLQFVTTLGNCPTAANDTNGDGIIDVVEGQVSFGKGLLPLDGDLSSQEAGADELPKANSLGVYLYKQDASFAALLADLQATDTDPNDLLVKLSPESELDLVGKAVVIHGVPDDVVLPATVATSEGTEAKDTVPIACGVIKRISGAAEEDTAGEETPTATPGETPIETPTAETPTTETPTTTP